MHLSPSESRIKLTLVIFLELRTSVQIKKAAVTISTGHSLKPTLPFPDPVAQGAPCCRKTGDTTTQYEVVFLLPMFSQSTVVNIEANGCVENQDKSTSSRKHAREKTY